MLQKKGKRKVLKKMDAKEKGEALGGRRGVETREMRHKRREKNN